MLLNRNNLDKILHKTRNHYPKSLSFPSRVIQFGTGVLLRALPEYCIHEANRKGVFNGGVQLIKTGPHGDILDFIKQDYLYTLRIEGIEEGKKLQQDHIISCISGVLDASTAWNAVLALATDPQINIIISNTTEAGIVEVEDSIFANPPISFPAKLTAYLYKRYHHFKQTAKGAMIILPTELIDKNGEELNRIVISLAKKENLGLDFLHWLSKEVYFCNTLVDRIVPGSLCPEDLGYQDNLMISAEPYLLWAIETDANFVKKELSFSTVVPGVYLVPSIQEFKEIKLRMLNASHSLMTGLAIRAQHEFVKDTLALTNFEDFLKSLINKEIKPSLQALVISEEAIDTYAANLIDRFKNPFLNHKWLAIAQNFTLKMKNRVVPLIESWYKIHNHPPRHIALGFAAYLHLMKQQANSTTPIDKDHALFFQEIWQNATNPLETILADQRLWGTDLSKLPGWMDLMTTQLQDLQTNSIEEILIDYI